MSRTMCDHLRSVTRDGYRKWCNDCRAPLPLSEAEAMSLQAEVDALRGRVAYVDKWADLLDLIPGETFSAETIANALRTGHLPKIATCEPEVSGFFYDDSDPAAYRIRCDKCGESAGTLGRSEDYAHGWLDAWAYNHLEECKS